MIIHKLLYRFFKHRDDDVFYVMQAESSIEWLEKAGVALKPGTTVIDLGCGHGIFGAALRKRGCEVAFADQDDSHLMPDLKSSRFLRVNLDEDDYASLGQYDLVVCSNVFEHLAKQPRFMVECAKLLKPGGKLYLSWTNWFSPFGGHDFAPFHYLGTPNFGRWVHRKVTGHWSMHVPGAGLYVTHIGPSLSMIRRTPGLRIERMATRYYPEFSFILRLPVIREFLAWNCALLISRT